ncbi:MAG: metal-dependent hydrolase [Bacteroidota bacterium]
MRRRTAARAHPKMEITWWGHSAFSIRTPGGRVVLVDPWLGNPRAPEGAADIAPVHLILVTHGHADHVGDTVAIARRTGARVVAIHEVSLYLQSAGLPNVTGMNKGGTLEAEDVAITMVDARHSGEIDAGGKLLPGGEPAGFVIRLRDGRSVYHAGDTSLFGDMRLIARLYTPTVAMLPIGDLYTMGPREAAEACTMLQPRHIIGMHYGTFPALTGTPDALRARLPARLRSRVRELSPGIPVLL